MKTRSSLLLLLAGGALAYWWYTRNSGTTNPDVPNPSDAVSFTSDPLAAMTELVTPWKNTGSAAQWLPALAAAESQYGIPTDLLARLAYQESRFREGVIRGTTASSAGALGMMQLMPQYFSAVNRPVPFTDQDVLDQIGQAAQQLASLNAQLGSWPLALAGYNAGAGAVRKYGGIPPFTETQNYVSQILADVPGVPA